MANKLEDLGIQLIVNYLRRSRQDIEKEKKTGEDTLHEQKLLMDRILNDYGIPFEQRKEVGSGDKISTRPVFQQVIKELESGKYEAIAVKEISRMGRGSYADMGIIYDLIVEKRIFIITPWKVYDPSNPSDLRQIRFELFMSREEFETTRERLNGGRYNSALQGKWVAGPAPFGFDYNKKTGKLEINEKEATTVRTIYDLYANGIVLENGQRKLVQFRALATYLKRIGIKTVTGKDEWAPNYLRTFLSNERFIGTLRFNVYRETSDGKRIKNPENEHVIIEDAHPPIISPEVWDKVQHRVNNRDVATNTKLDFEPNRLAGLCVCKKCGKKFIRRAKEREYVKRDGTVSRYANEFLFCGTTGCTYVRYSAIEDDIIETLKYLTDLDAKTLQKTLENISVADEPKNTVDDLKKYVKSKHEELERKMDFIFDKYESGVYSDEMFLERKTKIDEEIEELNAIRINEPAGNEKEYKVEKIKADIKNLVEAYETAATNTDKNNLLHSVFDSVEIEILEKGSGSRPSVHQISPYLKSSFLAK